MLILTVYGVPLCEYRIYPFHSSWTIGSFSALSYVKQCCCEHFWTCLLVSAGKFLLGQICVGSGVLLGNVIGHLHVQLQQILPGSFAKWSYCCACPPVVCKGSGSSIFSSILDIECLSFSPFWCVCNHTALWFKVHFPDN